MYLQKCFDEFIKLGILISVAKLIFFIPFGRLMGHIVLEQRIIIDLDKIAIIVSLPIPTIVTELKGFLGQTGYYQIFIFHYVVIAMPLIALENKMKLQCGIMHVHKRSIL